MARKETDLQKVIADLKSSIQDKELEDLKEELFSSTENINDLLQQESLQDTLQKLLKNKNVSKLLQNGDLQDKLFDLLETQGAENLMDQMQAMLNSRNSEKKK